MNYLEHINQAIFLQINATPESPTWLLTGAEIIANDVIFIIPTLLLVFWLWGQREYRESALKACAVSLLALGMGQIITMLWPHPRPFMIGLGHTWVQHAADASFPSDHFTVFACIGLTLLFDGFYRNAAAILLAGVCVAWARIFLGVHFPMDMVGAAVVAAASLLIITPLWRMAGQPMTTLFERVYRFVCAKPIAMGWIRR